MERAFETKVIRLALEVLAAAATRAYEAPADGAEVRLALRVLVPFVPDRSRLAAFWDEVGAGAGTPWNHARLVLRWIEEDLAAEGWEVTPPIEPRR